MELPKNITQIGETNPHCKIYVEDYVISYIKQLNRFAQDKSLAVGLYGVRKEEGGVTYVFLYGACKLIFLQRECRHLSQAVQQEAEKQRRRYFADYVFLGYRLLDGEMVEGFHICEQGVCRYIEGYAQFYEKNDSMLAFMVDERQEEVKPEEVNQEKYDTVKRRQEERRALLGEKSRHAPLAFFRNREKAPQERQEPAASEPVSGSARLNRMKVSAAAVFAVLCVTGLAAMSNGERLGELAAAAGRLMAEITERQLPDAIEVAVGSAQVGTIVAEDKLNDALLKENATVSSPSPTDWPTSEPAGQPTPAPTEQPGQPTPEPAGQPSQEPDSQPVSAPVSYTIQKGDTLIGICLRIYGSDDRVAEICTLNNISNPDDIKEGEKILLP